MPIGIGMLLFPDLTQLDLTGPFEMLHRVPDTTVHLLWKDTRPVRATSGLTLYPTTSLADSPTERAACPAVSVGCRWPRTRRSCASCARRRRGRVTSRRCALVRYCWARRACSTATKGDDPLGLRRSPAVVGARYRPGHVVVDRNRITGGGVTAGIDFGLRLAAELAGSGGARDPAQPGFDPAPPFDCGHPDNADPEMVAVVRHRLAAREAEFAQR